MESAQKKYFSLQEIERRKLLPNPPFPKDRASIKKWITKGRIAITNPSFKIDTGVHSKPRYYITLETINEWRKQYNQSPLPNQ